MKVFRYFMAFRHEWDIEYRYPGSLFTRMRMNKSNSSIVAFSYVDDAPHTMGKTEHSGAYVELGLPTLYVFTIM